MNYRTFRPAAIAAALCTLLLAACAVTKDAKLAGRINGTPIPESAFMDSYRGHYNNFQILNNRPPDNEERELIKRQTWQDATKHVILTDYFRKYSITATPQEVLDTLQKQVPDYIMNSPRFMTDGKFDPNIYNQSLQYDTPENMKPLRQHYQEYLIPIRKLQQILAGTELFTREDRKLATKILQSTADIQWTGCDPAALDPVVTDGEIQAYYLNNQEKFKLDPYYSLLYVLVPVQASGADILAAASLADSLAAELSAGSTASELLAKHQATAPYLVYKNSGFIRNDDLDPALYALLSQMPEGGFSAPVPDAEGLTIYQLEQRTKSMSIFNTLRVPHVPSQASVDLAKPATQRIVALASAIGLADAADEMDLALQDTGRIPATSLWIDDSRVVESILAQVKGQPSGFVSAPVYSQSNRAWLVAQVQENQLDNARALNEVSDQIRAMLVEQKRSALAQTIAGQILAGQTAPPTGLIEVHLPDMNYRSQLGGQSAGDLYYQVLRAHWLGLAPSYHALGGVFWVPRINSVKVDKSLKVASAELEAAFTRNLPSDWFDNWMAAKIKSANLRIFLP